MVKIGGSIGIYKNHFFAQHRYKLTKQDIKEQDKQGRERKERRKKKAEKRNERKECKVENEIRENRNITNNWTKLISHLF